MEKVTRANAITSVVPLLMVADMERALAFYVGGLGFKVQGRWIPHGHLRWCRIARDDVCLMLQEAEGPARERLNFQRAIGSGPSLYFACRDALAVYREASKRGMPARREPVTGEFVWEVFLVDPDGCKITFSTLINLPFA